MASTLRNLLAILAVVQLAPVGRGVEAQQRMIFSDPRTIGALDSPAEEVFDDWVIGKIAPDGSLVTAEVRVGTIRVFRPDGLIRSEFGRLGEGPGEFRYVTSIALAGNADTLYVWDHKLGRVTVFTGGGTRVRDFRPEVSLNGIPTMERHSNGGLLFLGAHRDLGEIAHRTTAAGEYLGSFADLLPAALTRPEMLKAQLSNANVCQARNGDWIVSLQAPYIVGRYSPDGVERWVVRDPDWPNPLDYITVTPEQYQVGAYPVVAGLVCVPGGGVLLHLMNPENESRTWHHRRGADGSLTSQNSTDWNSSWLIDLASSPDGANRGLLFEVSPYPKFTIANWRLVD